MASIYERCFVYSPTQKDELVRIESKDRVDKFKLGTVIVNGVAKNYTEIVTDMSKVKYPDATLVIKGDIRRIKFTSPG